MPAGSTSRCSRSPSCIGRMAARVLPGGIRIRLISGDGAGPHPSVSDVIKLNYEGRLTDGTVFDSSFARGEPEIFPLNQLIRGWQMAVPQMGVGDTAEIAIPAEFAYGPRAKADSGRCDALFQNRAAGNRSAGLSAARSVP